MSRSRRHTPIIGNTTAGSEKSDKQRANRRYRQTIKRLCRGIIDDMLFPVLREVSDVWNHAKDGKRYYMEDDGRK